MKRILKIILYLILAIVLLATCVAVYFWYTHEPNWYVERNAVKSESHPYAGFWKGENCKDNFGWAIGPVGENLYYISFCGPGGCFKEDTYRPNTDIVNDLKYNIIDENTIAFWSKNGWSTHVRCTTPHKKAFKQQ
jgi:hypothetical protein